MTALSSRLPSTTVMASDLIPVTLSLDTSAYADGDVLADMQAVADCVRVEGGRAIIQSITVLDKSDQGTALDIFISPSSASLGTENSAPNISAANTEGMQYVCRIATSDYIDLGNARIATVKNIGLMVEAAAGTTTLYIGAITRGGTPTYSAAGIIIYLGMLWH